MRSGAQTLTLLATPIVPRILQGLADGPKQQVELGDRVGCPAQTTLRAQLKALTQLGVIERHRQNGFPGVLEYELTASGRDLLDLATVLERWLHAAPGGPLSFGEGKSKTAIKAFAEGWSATMLRAMAARPLSLTELDRVIGSLSYPSLERRLVALRSAGLLEARERDGRGTPFSVSRWGREGIGALVTAIRWERRHATAQAPSVKRLDAEAMFLLPAPLLSLSEEAFGSCRMAVELPDEAGRRIFGVTAEVAAGRVESCVATLDGSPDAWAIAPVTAWLDAIANGDTAGIEQGGDCGLAAALLAALHRAFPAPPRQVKMRAD